ncbi:MAG: DUF1579 domain-containing protein [Phycisphaerales bacterium]|nr:DUF1579 domain-containing protein [Phycisphaerales bacterium]
MVRNVRIVLASLGVLVLTAAAVTVAQSYGDDKPRSGSGQENMPLPPGMTEADMKAMMEAATPGPMHAHLAKSLGVWEGRLQCWMEPGADPTITECTSTLTALLDGRFVMCEVAGDMGGMGPFKGIGLYGYDNAAKKFQSVWLDSMGTGMAYGTGELSEDGKMLTWAISYHCPVQKKEVSMRQVERYTGKDSMTLEFYGPDMKTGKEHKMMEISYTRKAGAPTASAGR